MCFLSSLRFEPDNLFSAQRDSQGKVYEAGFQQEFLIQADYFEKTVKVQTEFMYLADELAGQTAGCLDFRLTFVSQDNIERKWGIELLRFSSNLKEHVARFMPEREGAYAGLDDHIMVDFMNETEFKQCKYRNLDANTHLESKVLVAVFTKEFNQVTFYKWNGAGDFE